MKGRVIKYSVLCRAGMACVMTYDTVNILYCREKPSARISVRREVPLCGGKGCVILLAAKKRENEMMNFESQNAEQTYEFGKSMGEKAEAGQVYALIGDLGAGKTVFTQGFAAGLSVAGPVVSPTFTILQVYDDGRLPFYHFDVYRIEEIEEMDEIGYEECFRGDGVCLVEWADRIAELMPPDTIRIEIDRDEKYGDSFRRITVKGSKS